MEKVMKDEVKMWRLCSENNDVCKQSQDVELSLLGNKKGAIEVLELFKYVIEQWDSFMKATSKRQIFRNYLTLGIYV